ncbi:MAG: ParB/RepB/Spo0J family partition protein, partial [Sphingomonadaceae bacterium]
MSNSTDPIRFSVPSRPHPDKKKKLGKGLGALLGETRREEPLVTSGSGDNAAAPERDTALAPTGGLAQLAISSIDPLPGQPRKHFDEEALAELAASIAQRGVIQPIIVRPAGQGRYQLVAGERRWRAAQKARIHEIPALIRDLDEREVMALALIENIQREDLNPIEEARAYHRLAEEESLTQMEIARMVDKSRSHIANLQRLLSLPETVLSLVEAGDLSMGHARALIGHDNAAELANQAIRQKLSVRQIEKLARAKTEDGQETTRRPQRTARESSGDADIL